MRFVAFCCAICAAAAAWAEPATSSESPGPSRPIPGLTAVDAHPQGCTSCHIDMRNTGPDARLSTTLRAWERDVPSKMMSIARRASNPGAELTGKHPAVPWAVKDIPHSCIGCHRADATSAPPFARLVHLVHYSGGDGNHFLTIFGGQCTACHKLNLETGLWAVPSAPESPIK